MTAAAPVLECYNIWFSYRGLPYQGAHHFVTLNCSSDDNAALALWQYWLDHNMDPELCEPFRCWTSPVTNDFNNDILEL